MKRLNPVKPFFLIYLCFALAASHAYGQWNPNYTVGTISAKYVFAYNQVPDQLVEIYTPTYNTSAVLTYQWYQSSTLLPATSFTPISGATQSSYTFPGALTQTTYYKRKVTDQYGSYTFSNTVKVTLGSVNWENLNYVREHDVLTPGLTTWQAVDLLPVTQNLQLNADQLPVAQKLQTTTYLDGLCRPVEKVSRETVTPATGNTLWGDKVQFSQYDMYGRQPKKFLPYTIQYTTTPGTESGKYKASPFTDQSSYYLTTYNESSAYINTTYELNPLNRTQKINSPGASWANSAGNSASYDVNTLTDNVQIFSIGYAPGAVPADIGVYPANTLYKITHIDENGNQVIEYSDKNGRIILTKTQIAASPSTGTAGWICVYSIYDDFGLLRYRIQPEAVKYLDANNWDFTTSNAQTLLNEMCFRYEYDDKGRNILKKAPGAAPLNMIYDIRDRMVFMQDGNQAIMATPQWTVNLYDDIDRPVITALYNTNETIASLQNDIANSTTVATVTINNQGSPITDLVVDNRNTSVSNYTAQNSITFTSDAGGSFSSVTNDNFTAQINAAATTPTVTTTVAVYNNPIAAYINTSSVTVLKYLFYDDYSYAGAKSFNNSFTNTSAYSTSDVNVIPIAKSLRTLSYGTGSMVRVLGTNAFITSTEYYDEKGRHIQTLEDNIKQGQDITTMQYHWDGRKLSFYINHSTSNSGYSGFGILSKYLFDNLGRVTSIQKMYGTNSFKTISSYDYDDIGRLKTKHLDPGYTGSGKTEMESLAYSYNIHNQITGINKDYALKTANTTYTYNKWSNFFGMYLGFDNKDNVFNAAQLDGHVTGILWSTQGDDVQRKYDYTYDNAGRLANATFKEKQNTTDAWDNSKMDFSVTGGSGQITYDLNGNLLTMLQKGVIPGNSTPVQIDNLAYSYASYSNKLIKLVDNTPTTATNGQSGDFKRNNTTANPDYVYDPNGNEVIDLNKNATDLNNIAGANGISYNFLDKPEQIRIKGKGLIKILYDAEGNKLQKTYTPEGSTTSTVTTYINEFVYQETVTSSGSTGVNLSYINFEEGRIRVMQPVSQGNGYDALTIDGNMILPNGKKGVYDYYIRDYQGNVRMILTEETHTGSNMCTMEASRKTTEDAIFQGSGNEVENTRVPIGNIPGQGTGGGWHSNTSASVSQVGNFTGTPQTGPNVLLKVMAGDVVNASTQYYYQGTVTNTSGTTALTQDVINSLVGAISGSNVVSSLVHGNTTGIANQLAPSANAPFVNITQPDASATGTGNPKAYLTVLFFDERFNYVGTGSQYIRVSQAGDGASPLVLANIQAPKNGYAYVYVSNESAEPVYFDNMQVGLTRGRIIEEDHYYSFGLKIAGISSNKAPDINEGNINNKNLYNDKELIDEADLDWYDYGFRNYDPQIGRFTQLDPLTDEYPELTPYQYASNEPIANIDIDGLEAGIALSDAVMKLPEAAPNVVVTTVKHLSFWQKALKIADKVGSFVTQEVLPRVGGVLKTGVGLGIMALGAATSEFGVGIPILAFGADYGSTGLMQIVDGKNHKTLTQQALESVGMKEEDANLLVEGAAAYLSLGAAALEQEANTGIRSFKIIPKSNFTKSNFRQNLIERTGYNPGGLFQAHHIFPQKFETIFSRVGIDIHDPIYGAWWETVSHQQNARAYNLAWEQFLSTNPTKSQILEKGRELMKSFGYIVDF